MPLQRGKGLGMVVASVRPHVGRIIGGGRDDAASLVGVILRLTVTRPALVSVEFDQGICFVMLCRQLIDCCEENRHQLQYALKREQSVK